MTRAGKPITSDQLKQVASPPPTGKTWRLYMWYEYNNTGGVLNVCVARD